MSILQEVLRPLWLKGINNVSTGTTQSLKGWLSDGQFLMQSVSGIDGIRFSIFTASPRSALNAFAHDLDRFSSATFETVKGISRGVEIPHSTAWPLIRAYYSAFYAIHALSRIFGISISKLDAPQVTTLQAVARSSGFQADAAKINADMYRFEFDPVAQTVIGTKLTKGSHESTWSQFEKLLQQLTTKILESTEGVITSKQQVVDCLETIRDILRTAPCGNGNWLSHIRNNINYRHDYGTWYPHGAGAHRDMVWGLLSRYKSDPMTIYSLDGTKDLVKFTKCCVLLVALLRVMIEDISRRHFENDSFLSKSAVLVLAQARLG